MNRQARKQILFLFGIILMISTIGYKLFNKQDQYRRIHFITTNTGDFSKVPVKLVRQENAFIEDTQELLTSHRPSPVSTTRASHAKEWDNPEEQGELTPCPRSRTWSGTESNKDWAKFKEALRRYTMFHQRQVEKIKRGDPTVRTLIYVCEDSENCRGIGDQFYRIQQLLLLAIASNRVLLLKWGEKSMRSFKYLVPNQVEWTAHVMLSSEVLRQYPIIKRLKLKNIEDYLKFIERIRSDSHTHIRTSHALPVPFTAGINRLLHTDASLFDRLSLGKILETVPLDVFSGELLRYLFTFAQEALREVDNAQKLIGVFDKPYIGVHIRTGFYGTEFEEIGQFRTQKISRTEDTWSNTIKCSLGLSDTASPPNDRLALYLATDSYDVKKLAAEERDPRIKMLNVTLQHVAFHTALDKSRRNVDHLESKSDEETSKAVALSVVEGHMATWIDFLLLARADILVHSTSGFSTVAGQFCSAVRKHYFSPHCTHKP